MLKIICPDKELEPTVGVAGSGGYDLKLSMDISIPTGKEVLVGTGVRVQIPEGHVGLVVPRSSTGKKALELTNTCGVIDHGYQGEIMLSIRNVGRERFLGYKYDRLFQMLIVPVHTPKVLFVTEFDEPTTRGEGGFGSSDTITL